MGPLDFIVQPPDFKSSAICNAAPSIIQQEIWKFVFIFPQALDTLKNLVFLNYNCI